MTTTFKLRFMYALLPVLVFLSIVLIVTAYYLGRDIALKPVHEAVVQNFRHEKVYLPFDSGRLVVSNDAKGNLYITFPAFSYVGAGEEGKVRDDTER